HTQTSLLRHRPIIADDTLTYTRFYFIFLSGYILAVVFSYPSFDLLSLLGTLLRRRRCRNR
ncbi:hypothetical protein EDD15DRAFT_2536167, partial [Pisolithus albus]